MHGYLCQKAYAGAHHFKDPPPLNSNEKRRETHPECAAIASHSHTQTHKALEDTHVQISFRRLKDESTQFFPHQALLFHKCSQKQQSKTSQKPCFRLFHLPIPAS